MKRRDYRIETDFMGKVKVPRDAYYGAQTQRALENFPISGLRFPRVFIWAMGLIKEAGAQANQELGLLEKGRAKAIRQAAHEVAEGIWDDQFVVDIFQTGSGTSTNMNANEVIANRAIELLGGKIGTKSPVHPNDHVNLGQSTNDVIPSAIHMAATREIVHNLIPALMALRQSLANKAKEFDRVIKIGRTHLQDALPIKLGQEFGGYARQIELGIKRLKAALPNLSELTLGGTAMGTGFGSHVDFARRAISIINRKTKLNFREAKDRFAVQGGQDAVLEASNALKSVAVSLLKIANDVRWLSSGPRCGIGEIRMTGVQPGSSFMPGKVNPVIAESVIQVAAQVMGNDTAITIGVQRGNFELNTMLPLMGHNLLQSTQILASAARNFKERCIDGLEADVERCKAMLEKSLALATALVPEIGYDRAAGIAKKALKTGKTIREVVLEENILPSDRLKELLDFKKMTKPGLSGKKGK